MRVDKMNDKDKDLKNAKRNHLLFIVGLIATTAGFMLAALVEPFAIFFYTVCLIGLIVVIITTIDYLKNYKVWNVVLNEYVREQV